MIQKGPTMIMTSLPTWFKRMNQPSRPPSDEKSNSTLEPRFTPRLMKRLDNSSSVGSNIEINIRRYRLLHKKWKFRKIAPLMTCVEWRQQTPTANITEDKSVKFAKYVRRKIESKKIKHGVAGDDFSFTSSNWSNFFCEFWVGTSLILVVTQ